MKLFVVAMFSILSIQTAFAEEILKKTCGARNEPCEFTGFAYSEDLLVTCDGDGFVQRGNGTIEHSNSRCMGVSPIREVTFTITAVDERARTIEGHYQGHFSTNNHIKYTIPPRGNSKIYLGVWENGILVPNGRVVDNEKLMDHEPLELSKLRVGQALKLRSTLIIRNQLFPQFIEQL